MIPKLQFSPQGKIASEYHSPDYPVNKLLYESMMLKLWAMKNGGNVFHYCYPDAPGIVVQFLP